MSGKYLELIEHRIDNRGHIVNFDQANVLLGKQRDYPSYTSMFLFDD